MRRAPACVRCQAGPSRSRQSAPVPLTPTRWAIPTTTPLRRSSRVSGRQGAQTISFTQPPDTALTAGPVTLTATATSGLTVTFSSVTTGVCTISGNSVTLVSAGTCTIDADQAGDANYAPAPTVAKSFVVGKGTNVITFKALPNGALGSGSFTVSATASSGLAVTFASLTPSTCSVSGTTVSLIAVGKCTIEASQAGDTNYAAAAPVDQGFTIGKAVTSITIQAPGSILYGHPLTLTATVTGANPTGSVAFLDGGTMLASVGLTGGVAAFTTKSLATGTHNLAARYGGDASNLPTTSKVVSVVIDSRPDPSKDPDVIGLVNAQVTAMQRFGQTQMDNIGGRLNQMHGNNDNGPVSLGMTIGTPQSQQSQAAQPSQQWFAGGVGGALAYAGDKPSGASGAGGPLSAIAAGTAENVRPLVHIWTAGSVSFGKVKPGGGVDNTFTTPGITVGIRRRATRRAEGWHRARLRHRHDNHRQQRNAQRCQEPVRCPLCQLQPLPQYLSGRDRWLRQRKFRFASLLVSGQCLPAGQPRRIRVVRFGHCFLREQVGPLDACAVRPSRCRAHDVRSLCRNRIALLGSRLSANDHERRAGRAGRARDP